MGNAGIASGNERVQQRLELFWLVRGPGILPDRASVARFVRKLFAFALLDADPRTNGTLSRDLRRHEPQGHVAYVFSTDRARVERGADALCSDHGAS